MSSSETPQAPTQSEARAEGRKTLARGALMVGVCLGLVLVAAAAGWSNVMFSGTLLIVGWAYFGFGVCESLFGAKLRLVRLLLTVFFMIFGVGFSFWFINLLGFRLNG